MLATTWYRKKDWPRWLELDPEFQPDYDHWLKRMEGQIAALEKQGVLVEKVVARSRQVCGVVQVSGL